MLNPNKFPFYEGLKLMATSETNDKKDTLQRTTKEYWNNSIAYLLIVDLSFKKSNEINTYTQYILSNTKLR